MTKTGTTCTYGNETERRRLLLEENVSRENTGLGGGQINPSEGGEGEERKSVEVAGALLFCVCLSGERLRENQSWDGEADLYKARRWG